ncbi:hypothetical protein GDO86_003963 [Hymenochirus boettgeri]|uniref:Uncharacterized protein n=1 Tax=Hymenochirus boettgeri TaxID=247094 RepID=A0A8T2KBV4_9PIPI|nr:hypothetical protein GDO86_003963 [Hymenochirus boettgeri]
MGKRNKTTSDKEVKAAGTPKQRELEDYFKPDHDGPAPADAILVPHHAARQKTPLPARDEINTAPPPRQPRADPHADQHAPTAIYTRQTDTLGSKQAGTDQNPMPQDNRLRPNETPTIQRDSLKELLLNIPTKEDLIGATQQIQQTCRTEIAALRGDLGAVLERVEDLEATQEQTNQHIGNVTRVLNDHSRAIRDLFRQMEDLENRGRRNNIRIRGLPETVQDGALLESVTSLFHTILESDPSQIIELDRIHRSLRPKASSKFPRDVICRVHYFAIKEQILTQYRTISSLTHEGAEIQLFPDLSPSTLARRRQLRPLLQALRDKKLAYRWGFPFQLIVRHEGTTHTLSYPEDLSSFCNALQLPEMKLPDWKPAPILPHSHITNLVALITKHHQTKQQSWKMRTTLLNTNYATTRQERCTSYVAKIQFTPWGI